MRRKRKPLLITLTNQSEESPGGEVAHQGASTGSDCSSCGGSKKKKSTKKQSGAKKSSKTETVGDPIASASISNQLVQQQQPPNLPSLSIVQPTYIFSGPPYAHQQLQSVNQSHQQHSLTPPPAILNSAISPPASLQSDYLFTNTYQWMMHDQQQQQQQQYYNPFGGSESHFAAASDLLHLQQYHHHNQQQQYQSVSSNFTPQASQPSSPPSPAPATYFTVSAASASPRLFYSSSFAPMDNYQFYDTSAAGGLAAPHQTSSAFSMPSNTLAPSQSLYSTGNVTNNGSANLTIVEM